MTVISSNRGGIDSESGNAMAPTARGLISFRRSDHSIGTQCFSCMGGFAQSSARLLAFQVERTDCVLRLLARATGRALRYEVGGLP